MSHLLFMDESGHHGGDGYEVHGGIILPVKNVWNFTCQMRGLEQRCLGEPLRDHGKELKAIKLLEPKRIRLAGQNDEFSDERRCELCREYFGQTRNGVKPTLEHNIAYAQGGIKFVDGLLGLITKQGGKVFATIVPAGHQKPPKEIQQNFVRRDMRYLMNALHHFCEEESTYCVLVFDESDRSDDKRFLARLERYFSGTPEGKEHSKYILPTPLFSDSQMSYPIQAADIVCYLISKSFRLRGMTAPRRDDINAKWIKSIENLRYVCRRSVKDSGFKTHYSILYVKEPW